MTKARAVVFLAPRSVELQEVELPEVGEEEVFVTTSFSGISGGTEMLAYRGEIDPHMPVDEVIDSLEGSFSYPFRYGYSCVGVVERSRSALPEGTRVFAFHPHQDRFVAQASDVVPLDDIDPRTGTLFPLVETALQVSLDAGPVRQEPVVVLGLGAVGLVTAALLRKSGAQVLASDLKDWRRQAAAALNVLAVPPELLDERIMRDTEGRGVSLVVEATGNPKVLGPALSLLAHEGTALVASWYGTKPVSLPLGGDFHRRRLVIRSSQVSTIPSRLAGRWTVERRRAVTRSLLRELPLDALTTHEFPFSEVSLAFEAVDRCDPGLIHAGLRYG
ncbi:MAG: zinc-binding alcohol dehydrogenase [Actinomycetota bacterium]|nr:zinc-binding alcohol dehydrogenase [Actinomycetota bacterium]